MDRGEGVDGFEFHDELFIDKEVDAVALVELQAFVFERQLYLSAAGDILQRQFMFQAPLISGFKQSRP